MYALPQAPAALPAAPVPKQDNQRSCWVFTAFVSSYVDAEAASEEVETIGSDSKYCVVGLETCPTTGREHYQGYVVWNTKTRFTALKKKYNPAVHWEAAKGTHAQNYDYCTKEGKFNEYGEVPRNLGGEMEKERWKIARGSAVLGQLDDVDDQIFITHYRNLKAIRNDAIKVLDNLPDTCGIWYYGVPGSGKSHRARELAGDQLYLKACNKWWDGYQGQENVLIEDMDPTHAYMAHYLKCWTDKYPFTGEVKSATLSSIRPKQIIITSNYTLDEIFASCAEIDTTALKRRFKVTNFPYKYGEVPATPTHSEDQAMQTQEFVTPPSKLRRSFTVRGQPLKKALIVLPSDSESDSDDEVEVVE